MKQRLKQLAQRIDAVKPKMPKISQNDHTEFYWLWKRLDRARYIGKAIDAGETVSDGDRDFFQDWIKRHDKFWLGQYRAFLSLGWTDSQIMESQKWTQEKINALRGMMPNDM